MPSVSIALCTFERPDPLKDTVTDLLQQLPPDGEVVVVDQSLVAAEENSAWIARLDDTRIRYVTDPVPGLPRARNRAIAETSAEKVIFFDDDVRLLPGVVSAHLRALDGPAVGGVVGRIVERSVRNNASPGTNVVDAWGRIRTHLEAGPPGAIGSLKGANMSFRREALAAVGAFDEGFLGTAILEDADISERLRKLGFVLCFAPDAALIHLSAEAGGVRKSRREAERWRFENTGYFVGKHRGAQVAMVRAMFSAIAIRRAWEWGEPGAIASLMSAFHSGLGRATHGV